MPEVPLKRCTKCEREWPMDEAHFNKSGDKKGCGFRSQCRWCRYPANGAPPVDAVPEGFELHQVGTLVDGEGQPEKQWIKARRESEHIADVLPAMPPGQRLKGASTLIDGATGQVRLQWIKTDVERDKEREYILDAIKHMADEWPERLALPAPEHVDDDLLCVYPMGDPHFGMYAWAAETGDDYDLELAEQYHVAAMEALVRCSPPAKNALVIDLGDFFHMDNSSNMTPRSGHVLDVDTRRPKVFRAGVRSFRKLIDLTQSKHEHTDVWVVPGNHDQDSSAPMQIALEMFYESNPRVFIDPSPAIALYKRFGDNLIGSTHTHTIRDRMSLGEMMATQRKQDWGQTEHRYWYCGHVHHDSLVETRGGVLVETFRTLAGKDKYAADNFYNAGRDMKCDVLHRIDGRVTRNIIGIRQIKRRIEQSKPRGERVTRMDQP